MAWCARLHLAHTVPLRAEDVSNVRSKAGNTKLIVIDPRKTEAGRYADLWLQVRRGTDTALLMAWINVIIEEASTTRTSSTSGTFGFDELRARAAEYTPEKVAEITWVARQISSARPRAWYATTGRRSSSSGRPRTCSGATR